MSEQVETQHPELKELLVGNADWEVPEDLDQLQRVLAGELPVLYSGIHIFKLLAASDLKWIAGDAVEQMTRHANEFGAALAAVTNATKRDFRWENDRINSIRANLKNAHAAVFLNCVQYLVIAPNRSEAEYLRAALSADEAEDTLRAIKAIESSARDLAAGKAVALHSESFEEEAMQGLKATTKWFWGTFAVAVVGLLTASVVFLLLVSDVIPIAKEPTRNIQIGVASVAFFSMIYFLLAWSSRTYRAHLHNVTVNRHRRNALKTFEVFSAGAHDDETKRAVLLQAAQCIFSPQVTGFAPGSEGDPGGPSLVSDFVRSGALRGT